MADWILIREKSLDERFIHHCNARSVLLIVLRWMIEIKPGMTRKDILKIFTTEGGLSFGRERRYVLKQCPYIKVDVDFAPAADGQSPFTDLPDDKITKISRPYLEYSIMD